MIIRYRAALQPILVGLSLLALISSARALSTCAPVTLSDGPAALPEEQEDPAVSGSNIYLAYSDSSGLVVRVSHDRGLTWASKILDPAGILPRIVASGNNVYIAWLTGAGASWSLEFARSTDKGTTFSPAAVLGPFYAIEMPTTGDGEVQIAVSGALVAIISHPDATDMVVYVSNDRGRTFSQVVLPTFGVLAIEEYIAAFGRNIAAVWNDFGSDGLAKIILSTSADAGQTFSAPQNLTADGVAASEPLLAVSPNTGSLYMVWREHGTPYGATVGFLSKSTDFGVTWSTPRLVQPGVTRGRQYSVAAVDPNVYVTYLRNQADGYWWPQLRVSHNGAMSFGASISLGNSGLTGMLRGEEHAPRLWASDTRLRVVYDVHGKLFMSASGNSGASFGPRIALGPGAEALATQNTALWLADNGSVRFAICK